MYWKGGEKLRARNNGYVLDILIYAIVDLSHAD